MSTPLRQDAEKIIKQAIAQVMPEEAVRRCLCGKTYAGKLYLVAVGKAAWQMAQAAVDCLGTAPEQGIVVTKYNHIQREIEHVVCYEAGHPVPDENSYSATDKVLEMTKELQETDTVLFLLSGGGSALFESPLIPKEELTDITNQLLACGAEITEINTIRKRMSAVKGGRFAKWCEPAKVEAVILSDILGDPLDMIASGPTVADASTVSDALRIAEKYRLVLSDKARELLAVETPKEIRNTSAQVVGSVRELCRAAEKACIELGYESIILTDCLCGEAREAGSVLGSIGKTHALEGKRRAFIAGGETIVHLKGKGLGGRNQELALAAAKEIAGLANVAVFSVGSDGTDGPTDAAGGYVDGATVARLLECGKTIDDVLEENDAYHGLKSVKGLIMTGATGTNVNDVSVVLIDEK